MPETRMDEEGLRLSPVSDEDRSRALQGWNREEVDDFVQGLQRAKAEAEEHTSGSFNAVVTRYWLYALRDAGLLHIEGGHEILTGTGIRIYV